MPNEWWKRKLRNNEIFKKIVKGEKMKDIITSNFGAILTAFVSIITIILTNKHHEKITNQQIQASERQIIKNHNLEKQKIVEDHVYKDKVEIIKNILLIKSMHNLTENYIMDVSDTSLNTVNQRYEEIKMIIITIIEKLYLSFPQFVDKGYKISGKCNEIWGNEQNYFGYQRDKPKYQLNTKEKLITLYNELNDICSDLLSSLNYL